MGEVIKFEPRRVVAAARPRDAMSITEQRRLRQQSLRDKPLYPGGIDDIPYHKE